MSMVEYATSNTLENEIQPDIPAMAEAVIPKKKDPWWILIVLAVLLVGAVAVLISMWLSSAKKAETVSISDLSNRVLYLEVYDKDGEKFGYASGFLINDRRTLVTNYHVIEDAYTMKAFPSGSNRGMSVGTVLAYDEDADLAILQCDYVTGVEPLVLGDSSEVKQGDRVYASGYPLGMSNTLSDGIISSVYTDEYDVDILQITAAISEGSSGGALMNEDGEVIGVVAASYVYGENMNMAITSNTVKELLETGQQEQSLEAFYMRKCPQLLFKDYYPCVRMISAYPEDETKEADWEDAELALEWLFWEWYDTEDTEEYLIELLDEYGEEQYGGDLVTVYPGDFEKTVEDWCYDRMRRTGDIEIIETEVGYTLCYYSDAIEIPVEEEEPEVIVEKEPEPVEEETEIEEPVKEAPVSEGIKEAESVVTPAPTPAQTPSQPAASASFRIEPFQSFVMEGSQLQLKVVGAEGKVTWTSSSPEYIPVSDDGVVSVLDAVGGRATITATTDTGLLATCCVLARIPSQCTSSNGMYVFTTAPGVPSLENVFNASTQNIALWDVLTIDVLDYTTSYHYRYQTITQEQAQQYTNSYIALLRANGFVDGAAVYCDADYGSADGKYGVNVGPGIWFGNEHYVSVEVNVYLPTQ